MKQKRRKEGFRLRSEIEAMSPIYEEELKVCHPKPWPYRKVMEFNRCERIPDYRITWPISTQPGRALFDHVFYHCEDHAKSVERALPNHVRAHRIEMTENRKQAVCGMKTIASEWVHYDEFVDWVNWKTRPGTIPSQ